MYDYNMLTPGPSKVRKNVLEARAIQAGNSDLDPEFYDFYKRTCAKYSHFLNTANPSFLLSGEGILGLEAACASLTEPGDRVLVLDNGIFGRGFADFVRIYGGEPVLFSTDPHAPIAPEALRAALFSREQSWLWFLATCALAAWLITLAVQLLWRAGQRSAIQPARAARRAIRTYRLTLLWLCAVNAAFAAVVWLAGGRWIPGRTGWDLAAYFGCYALNVLAAAAVSRLAAPPAISGRHAFFKRL